MKKALIPAFLLVLGSTVLGATVLQAPLAHASFGTGTQVNGIAVDQVPLTDALRVIEDGLDRASVSDGVPIAPIDTIVIMKLLAGRTQDLADVEAIVGSGADRELLQGHAGRRDLHGAGVAKQLLDRRFGQRGLLRESLALVGMLEQGQRSARDEVDGGLVAREEQQRRHAEQLVLAEAIAFLLADILEAYYRSTGQSDRVARLNASGTSFPHYHGSANERTNPAPATKPSRYCFCSSVNSRLVGAFISSSP